MKIILEIPDETMFEILKKAEEEYVNQQDGLNEFANEHHVNPAPAYRLKVEELIQKAISEYCE